MGKLINLLCSNLMPNSKQMTPIIIRKASEKDIDFIIDTIVMAEKGNGPNISYCSLFNINELEFRLFLKKILNEEIDNFEFSLSAFRIAESEGKAVGAYGAWIENVSGLPSGLLKISAFKSFLKPESLSYYSSIVSIPNEIGFKRTPGTMQFESLYIIEQFRGKGVGQLVAQSLTDELLHANPAVKTAQLQLIRQNAVSLAGQLRFGFEVVDEKTTENPDIYKFYPGNTRVLMEKQL